MIPEIPMVLEVTDPPTFRAALTDVFEVPASQPQVSVEGLGTASSPLVSHDSPLQQLEEVTPYPPPPKVPGSTQDSGESSGKSPPRGLCKKDLPCPPPALGTTGISIPEHVSEQTKTSATTTSTPASTPTILPALLTEAAPIVTVEGARDVPSVLPPSSLSDLVNKFGQIKNKLQSPPTSVETPLF
ncbi:hypothetical protein ACFX2H_012628 [Malus domestica]